MENNILRIFANNLKIYIKQAGMNQKEFAAKVGVSETCVSKWLLMKTEPTYTNIYNILKVLKCTYEELSDSSIR